MIESSRISSLCRFAEIGVGIYEAQLMTGRQVSAAVREATKATTWKRATVFREGQSDVLNTESRYADVLYRWSAINLLARLSGQLLLSTRIVAQALAPAATVFSDVQIVRYSVGGQFRMHRDNCSYRRGRAVTVLCYLNDGFTGGALVFPELHLSYAPRPGYGIIFPSTLLHAAERVDNGQKYVLTGWYSHEVGKDSNRLDWGNQGACQKRRAADV